MKEDRKKKLKRLLRKKDLQLTNLVIDELEHYLLMRKTALALSKRRRLTYID